jgi:hypothetical protein
MLRKYWIGILALGLLVIAVVIIILPSAGVSNSLSNVTDRIELTITILGWTLFFIQYLYNKSEKIYIFGNSIRLWLTNETIKWNFNVDFSDMKNSCNIDEISELITTHTPKAIIWHKDADSLIINLPGYSIRIFMTLTNSVEEQIKVLGIQISNLELPFRSFKARIEKEIIPLLQDLGNYVKPSNQKYVAKIGFTDTNPFFGFFIRKLELPKVVSFACDILETNVGGHPQAITIRKDKIEIVTDNLLALQSLSFRYVSLSSQ